MNTDSGRSAAEQGGCGPEFDPRKPRSARLHDFWLGGKDHFAADRAAGAAALAAYPHIASSARATRAFLVRAVRFLAAEEGIRQFLDIGAGMPAVGSANTHEVALAVSPECRVLYADNDPAVGAHARARLTSEAAMVRYAEADLRDPEGLLAAAAQTLDLTQPAAVMLIAVLHLISDAEAPHAIVARLMAAVPAGSHLMLCHPAIDQHAGAPEAMTRLNEAMEQQRTLRACDDVARFFTGLELLPPGVVRPSQWRPDSPEEAGRPSAAWVGVARKPGRVPRP
ncbi:MAG TPA: SAM-dependent methyltransferase [Trebonia sp.]|nr:SAM-dependent methyltransferase [Trebonia sp.]